MSELFEALKAGDVSKSLQLIRSGGVDLNARGKDGPEPGDGGATCLIQAIRNFDIPDEVVFELLNQGADPNLQDTLDNDTPLMTVAKTYPYGADGLIKALLSKGAQLETKNKHGDTVLHVAASFGAPKVCEALIKAGANLKAKDRKGKTPMEGKEI